MKYAAVKKNMEYLYEWVWRGCQDIVLGEKCKVRTVLYVNFCVNREDNNNIYAQRNFGRIDKKVMATERAMQWADGGGETQVGDLTPCFFVTFGSYNATALLN